MNPATEPSSAAPGGVTIGIVANPVSARDIRRVVAHASNLQTGERVNMLLRLLSSAAACGVEQAVMMPDKAGQRALLVRALDRARAVDAGAASATRYPALRFLDFDPESTVADSMRATQMLAAQGVAAIVVLGGDGTHRAVVHALRQAQATHIPVVGISTGTNNAFPELREPTITGLALGLYASARLSAQQALAANKLIEVEISHADGRLERDIAIVDAVVSSDRFVGARAIWKPGSIRHAFLAFAEPECIGLSAIGGLLQPVPRRHSGGLAVQLALPGEAVRTRLAAPIAPGMVLPLDIADWSALQRDVPYTLPRMAGTIALDGERELGFDEGCRVRFTLREAAFLMLDVAACLQAAADLHLMRQHSSAGAPSPQPLFNPGD